MELATPSLIVISSKPSTKENASPISKAAPESFASRATRTTRSRAKEANGEEIKKPKYYEETTTEEQATVGETFNNSFSEQTSSQPFSASTNSSIQITGTGKSSVKKKH